MNDESGLRVAMLTNENDCDADGAMRSKRGAATRKLMEATQRGNIAAIISWLDGGGHVDATYDMPDGSRRDFTMLMFGSLHGQSQLVDMLLGRRASVDLQNSLGGTALMSAAAGGHPGIVRRLLQAGAQTGLRDVKGWTALAIAEGKGHN